MRVGLGATARTRLEVALDRLGLFGETASSA